jgi:hypothetical protein
MLSTTYAMPKSDQFEQPLVTEDKRKVGTKDRYKIDVNDVVDAYVGLTASYSPPEIIRVFNATLPGTLAKNLPKYAGYLLHNKQMERDKVDYVPKKQNIESDEQLYSLRAQVNHVKGQDGSNTGQFSDGYWLFSLPSQMLKQVQLVTTIQSIMDQTGSQMLYHYAAKGMGAVLPINFRVVKESVKPSKTIENNGMYPMSQGKILRIVDLHQSDPSYNAMKKKVEFTPTIQDQSEQLLINESLYSQFVTVYSTDMSYEWGKWLAKNTDYKIRPACPGHTSQMYISKYFKEGYAFDDLVNGMVHQMMMKTAYPYTRKQSNAYKFMVNMRLAAGEEEKTKVDMEGIFGELANVEGLDEYLRMVSEATAVASIPRDKVNNYVQGVSDKMGPPMIVPTQKSPATPAPEYRPPDIDDFDVNKPKKKDDQGDSGDPSLDKW